MNRSELEIDIDGDEAYSAYIAEDRALKDAQERVAEGLYEGYYKNETGAVDWVNAEIEADLDPLLTLLRENFTKDAKTLRKAYRDYMDKLTDRMAEKITDIKELQEIIDAYDF